MKKDDEETKQTKEKKQAPREGRWRLKNAGSRLSLYREKKERPSIFGRSIAEDGSSEGRRKPAAAPKRAICIGIKAVLRWHLAKAAWSIVTI